MPLPELSAQKQYKPDGTSMEGEDNEEDEDESSDERGGDGGKDEAAGPVEGEDDSRVQTTVPPESTNPFQHLMATAAASRFFPKPKRAPTSKQHTLQMQTATFKQRAPATTPSQASSSGTTIGPQATVAVSPHGIAVPPQQTPSQASSSSTTIAPQAAATPTQQTNSPATSSYSAFRRLAAAPPTWTSNPASRFTARDLFDMIGRNIDPVEFWKNNPGIGGPRRDETTDDE